MSIAAMIASIKFNDRRNKREAFGHIGSNTDTQSKGIKVEPISEEQLQKIRKKLKKQRKKASTKHLIALTLGISATVLFIYLAFEYFNNSIGISGDFLSR